MGQDEPILTICIPTFNRGNYLKESVEYMIPVCKLNGVDILISDNASTDNTESVVKELHRKYSRISYYRHPENIGPDDNYEFILKYSKTKYCWLMSDTTFVTDMKDVVDDLRNNEYDVYILGGEKKRIRHMPQIPKTYDNSIDVMREVGWHLSWISAMIYNKNIIEKTNFRRFKNSSFNQTALVFEDTAYRECCIKYNPYVLIDHLKIEQKTDSKWIWHVFDVVGRQWFLLIMSLSVYYPFEVKMECIRGGFNYPAVLSMRSFAIRRMKGMWNFADYKRNWYFIKQMSNHKILLAIIGLCPKFLFRFFDSIIKMVTPVLKPIYRKYFKRDN